MTATIVYADGITEYPRVTVSGDGVARASYWMGRKASGQLWERVAEREHTLTDYTLTTGRIKRERIAKKWRTIRNQPTLAHLDLIRGPALGPFPVRAVGGIIRAGERIK
jgi:hypothetical protein